MSNLTCVMYHFNGPKAVKKGKTPVSALLEKALAQLAPGQEIWFAATGEPSPVSSDGEVGSRRGPRV